MDATDIDEFLVLGAGQLLSPPGLRWEIRDWSCGGVWLDSDDKLSVHRQGQPFENRDGRQCRSDLQSGEYGPRHTARLADSVWERQGHIPSGVLNQAGVKRA